ncbi:hypothetical protein BDF22DRAFT_674447 [Syncephalis plumigaleata]|nr:hypothetical protein BDF22DRAFT_674447 [Syncephalis plumigaleata]
MVDMNLKDFASTTFNENKDIKDIEQKASAGLNVVKDKAGNVLHKINPLDHLKETILTPVQLLSIIALAIYFALFLLHCWRFKQTRTKHHAVMAFGLLLATISMILQVASHEFHIVAISMPITALANLIAFCLCAYLLGRWSRSMEGFSGILNRLATPITILLSCAFVLGTAIVAMSWGLIVNLLFDDNIITVIAKFFFFFPLYYVGHSLLIFGAGVLLIYALLMLIFCPRHNIPSVRVKRRQMMLLVVLIALLLGASLSMLLFEPYPSYCIMALFYMAHYSRGPAAMASMTRVTPESNGRSSKKSGGNHLRVMHLPNADLESDGPPSCIAGIHKMSPTVSANELESVTIHG